MADGDNNRRDIVRQQNGEVSNVPTGKSISLGKNTDLDLSGLTEEQIQILKVRHAEKMIDVSADAQKKVVDVQTLDATLRSMSENTSQVAESGQSVTITNSVENELGRTEIIMGTSDAARRGKLSRSQAGGKDYTLLWAGLAVFVIIIVALIVIAG